jgi:hypothetical protein
LLYQYYYSLFFPKGVVLDLSHYSFGFYRSSFAAHRHHLDSRREILRRLTAAKTKKNPASGTKIPETGDL